MLYEIVNDSGMGALINLNDVDIAESNMTPLEIWCNESQERYVLIVRKTDLKLFESISKRENCPIYLIGQVTRKKKLIVTYNDKTPIDLPMEYLLGKPPIKPIKINAVAQIDSKKSIITLILVNVSIIY